MDIVIYIFAGIGAWCTITAVVAMLLILIGGRIDARHLHLVEEDESSHVERTASARGLDWE